MAQAALDALTRATELTEEQVNAARDVVLPHQVGGAPNPGDPGALFEAAVIQREVRAAAQALVVAPAAGPAPMANNPRFAAASLPILKEATGDAWLSFRRKFRVCCQINGWDDQRQRLQVLLAMDGDALARVQDLEPIPDPLPVPWSVELFLDQLEARFVHASDSVAARVAYRQACQKREEGVGQWHSRLRALHVRAWRNRADRDQDCDLIHQYGWGLRVAAVKRRVIEENPNTYTRALELAFQAESAQLILDNGSHSGGAHSINEMGGGAGATGKQCWSCGERGHLRRDCPKGGSSSSNSGRSSGGFKQKPGKPKGSPPKGAGRNKNSGFGGQKKVNAMGGEEDSQSASEN